MARIDSILAMLTAQGANELRVGTDREPKLLAFGTQKRFSMPATNEETLRDLLGELLTPEREQVLREGRGRVDFIYEQPSLGSFQVGMAMRGSKDGFDVTFLKSQRAPKAAPRVEPPREVAVNPPPAPAQSQPQSQPEAFDDTTGTHEIAIEPVHANPDHFTSSGEFDAQTNTNAFDGLIAHAAAIKASDLHLAFGETPRARVDGVLVALDFPGEIDLTSSLPLSQAECARVARGESVDLGIEIPGTGRVRLHVFRTSSGIAAAIRLLPRMAPTIASLHMPIPLEPLIDTHHGLILVCGATGSGKSTTLAALCQEILRKRSIVLTTLEDPIEYGLNATASSLLRRREIGRDVPDFASGIRDALREDPDVILIGELRDAETIAHALTAAETGHLVLASLHSSGAASAIERIVDAFPPERHDQLRGQLADSLRPIIAQRLLPRARGGGRIPAVEVLRVNHAIAAIIREGKGAQLSSAMQSGKADGMITLERCLADRVIAKDIRLEDARASANDLSSLMAYLPK
ncbi:MAG: PilT/PilU family type 4a pilus ATPase [Polyangiaceae bacterium]